MILNTLNIDSLYNSISAILGLDRCHLENYISSNYWQIVESNYDDGTIESMDISELLNAGDIKDIDGIIMHHITPRPNEDSIWSDGIYTLPRTLITDNILSSHLKKYGFTFFFENKRVIMKKDGNTIDISKLNSSNLFVRLGGENSLNDFNVNGYLFVNDFYFDEIRGWLGSPEILKNIATAFNNHNIADSYADQCYNYYVSFSVPLEHIDITEFDAHISASRKTKILIKHSLNALAHDKIKKKTFHTMHNPIIMLKRDYNVPPCDIKKVWLFDSSKFPKLIPIEQ